MFVEMTRAEQTRWIGLYSCDNYKIEDDYSRLFGFAPYAKGDYVCCPQTKKEYPQESTTENRNKNNSNRKNQRPGKNTNQNKRRPNNRPTTQDPRREYPNNGQNFNADSNNRRPNQQNIFEESSQRPWNSNIRQDYPRQQQQGLNNEDPNRRNGIQPINQRPNDWDHTMRPSIPVNNFNPQITQYPMNNQWQSQNPSSTNNNGQNPNFNNNNNGHNPNFNNNNGQNKGQNLNNVNVNTGQNFQDPSSMFGAPFPQYPSGQPTGQPQFNQNPGFITGIPQDPNFGMSNPFPQDGVANVPNPYPQGNPFQYQGPQPVQPGFGTTNLTLGDQCSALIMSIPDYKSGCCGRDYAGDDRIIGRGNTEAKPPQNSVIQNFPTANQFMSAFGFPRFSSLNKRSVDNNTVIVENRITGGKATEIEEYPWTVLLVATFTDGYQDSSFNCGGSLISDRYVLTAAHCVTESQSRLKEVEVTLAEYDKRTFPNDCVNSRSEGRKCIKNLRFKAEDVIAHPYFDDTRLQNDIALIRLEGRAPYTEYIRPICLPPINIDSSDLKNLPVSVAGWGRNGKLSSNIKQSTTVHLIPQRECRRAYPGLTNRHLCAAGFTGEDTCKGDSGGPLMMLYQGTHFVSGIVSGKRADSPCGTSVPSLYTNVFNYIDWIMENVRN